MNIEKKLTAIELARRVFDVEAQSILALKERVNEAFTKAVDLIASCNGKIVISGIGKSGIIARKIASTMSSTGTPAIFLHPAESSHGDLGVIKKEDIVIAISYGGENPELNSLLTYITRTGIPLISMTGNPASDLALRSLIVLDVKVNREACPLGLAPTASSTATLAMGDALAMAVLEKKGFSAEDFALNHPGGSLGFKLSKVKDIMHAGKSMPVLQLSTPMKQVLTLMSHGEVRGAAGVLDDQSSLVGIITDGDIRRKLESDGDPLSGVASDLMTKSPRTIDCEEIAEKALFMMEQFRINLLFVVDKNSEYPKKPVGVIHVQDLIKAKVR